MSRGLAAKAYGALLIGAGGLLALSAVASVVVWVLAAIGLGSTHGLHASWVWLLAPGSLIFTALRFLVGTGLMIGGQALWRGVDAPLDDTSRAVMRLAGALLVATGGLMGLLTGTCTLILARSHGSALGLGSGSWMPIAAAFALSVATALCGVTLLTIGRGRR